MVMVAGQQDLTVRGFISRHFTGLSGSKAGRAVKNCPVKRIRDFLFMEEKEGRKAALDVCRRLLTAMKELSRLVPPSKLGGVSKENIAARMEQLFSIIAKGRYVRKEGFAGGKPFVVEVYYTPAGGARSVITGLNFSGTYRTLFDDNFMGVGCGACADT